MAATANVKLTLFQGTPENDDGTLRDVVRVKVLPETFNNVDATNVRLSTTSAGTSFFTKYQFQLVKTSDEDDFLSDVVLFVDSLLPNDSTGFFVNLPLVQGTLENGVVSLEDNTTYKVICTATVRGDPVVTQTGTAELTVTAQPKQRDNVNQGTLALGNFSTSDDTLNFSLTNTKIVSQAPATVNGVEGLTYNANQALIDEIILTVYEVDTNGDKQNEATHTYSIDMSSKANGVSKNAHFATQNGGKESNDVTGTLRAKGLTATSLVTDVNGKLATADDVANGDAAAVGDFMADTGATIEKDVETYSFSFNQATQLILKKGTSDQYFDFDNNTYVFVKLTVVSGSFSTVFESTVDTTVELVGSDPLISYPTGSPAPILISAAPNQSRLEVVQKTQTNGTHKLECKLLDVDPIAGNNFNKVLFTVKVGTTERTIEFSSDALGALRVTTAADLVVYPFTITSTDTSGDATPTVNGNIVAPNSGNIVLIGDSDSHLFTSGGSVTFGWTTFNSSGSNTTQNNIGQKLRELTYTQGRNGFDFNDGAVGSIGGTGVKIETTIEPDDTNENGVTVAARGTLEQGNANETSQRQLFQLISETANGGSVRPFNISGGAQVPKDGTGAGDIESAAMASTLEFAPVVSHLDGNVEFIASYNDSAATRSVFTSGNAFTPLRRLRQKVDIESVRIDIAVEDIADPAYNKTGTADLDTTKLKYYSNTFTIDELTTIENATNYLSSDIITTETNANIQFLSLTANADINNGTLSLPGYVNSSNGDSATVTIADNTAAALKTAIQSFNKVSGGAAVTIRANVLKLPSNPSSLGGVGTDEYEIHITLDGTGDNDKFTYGRLASTALLSYTKDENTTEATAETYTKYTFDLRNPTGTEANIFGLYEIDGTLPGVAVNELASGNRLNWEYSTSNYDTQLLTPDTNRNPFTLGSGNNATVQFFVTNKYGITNTTIIGNSYNQGVGTVALPNLIPSQSVVTVTPQSSADRNANQVTFTIKDDDPKTSTNGDLIEMTELEVTVKVTRGTTVTPYTMTFAQDTSSTDTVKLVDTRNATSTEGGVALFTVTQPGVDDKTTFNITLKNGRKVPGNGDTFSLQPNDIFEIVSTKITNAYGAGVTTDKDSYVLDGGAVTKGFTLGTTTNRFYSLRAEGVSGLVSAFRNNTEFDKALIKADLLETIVADVVTKDQNIQLRLANHGAVGTNNNYSELINANGAQETITIALFKADGNTLLDDGAKTIATRAAFDTANDGETSSALAATAGNGPGDVLSFAVTDTELGEFQAQASPVVKATVTLTTIHLNGDAIPDTYSKTFDTKLQVTRPTITGINIATDSTGTRELTTNPSAAEITATVTLDVVNGAGALKESLGVPTKIVSKLKVVPNNRPALNTSLYENPGGTNFTAAIAAAKAAAADPGQMFGVPASTFTAVVDKETELIWTGESISNDIPVVFSIPSALFGCELFVESHLEYEVSGGLASGLNGRKTRTLINGDAKYNLTTSANTEYLEQFTTATGNTGRIGANAATLTSLLTAQSNLAMLAAPIELLDRQGGFAAHSSAPNMAEFGLSNRDGVTGNAQVGVNFKPNGHVPSDALAITLLNGNETMSFKNNLTHNDKNEYNTAMRAGICKHVVMRTTDPFKLILNGRNVTVTPGYTSYVDLISKESTAYVDGRRTSNISDNEEMVILQDGATIDVETGAITDITKSVNTETHRTNIATATTAGRQVTVGDIIVFLMANEVSIADMDDSPDPAGALLYEAIAQPFGTNPAQDAPLIRTEGIIEKAVGAASNPDGALYLAATTAKHQAGGNAITHADADNVTRFGVTGPLTIQDVSLTASDLVASSNITLVTPNS